MTKTAEIVLIPCKVLEAYEEGPEDVREWNKKKQAHVVVEEAPPKVAMLKVEPLGGGPAFVVRAEMAKPSES